MLLGKIAIGDWLTALIALGSLVILFKWKVSNPLLVAVTAVIGLIAFPLLQPNWVQLHQQGQPARDIPLPFSRRFAVDSLVGLARQGRRETGINLPIGRQPMIRLKLPDRFKTAGTENAVNLPVIITVIGQFVLNDIAISLQYSLDPYCEPFGGESS